MLHPAAALHRECYMLHVTMVHGIMLRTEIYAARLHTRHISARRFLWAITCVSQADAQADEDGGGAEDGRAGSRSLGATCFAAMVNGFSTVNTMTQCCNACGTLQRRRLAFP